MFTVNENSIFWNDIVIDCDMGIDDAVEVGSALLVILNPETAGPNNAYLYNKDGSLLWRIEPYSGFQGRWWEAIISYSLNEDGLRLYTFGAGSFLVDLKTGKLHSKKDSK